MVWKRLCVLAVALLLCSGVLVGANTQNADAKNCGAVRAHHYTPTYGYVLTKSTGFSHKATYRFKMSGSQIRTLRCLASYLEIDFELRGYKLGSQWSAYRLTTNLPHGMKDAPFEDTGNPRPTVTNIHTKELRADKLYEATISWKGYVPMVVVQKVRLTWTPAKWGGNFFEDAFCNAHGRRPEWCIFGNSSIAAKMHDCFFRTSGGWLKIPQQARDRMYRVNYNYRNTDCNK